MISIFSTPAEVLEQKKEELFINFQKNNKPSGLEYIRKNSIDYFYEAIKDDVANSPEDVYIIVKQISAEVVDVTQEGLSKIGSVRYIASISTNGVMESIDEMWHFRYDGWRWALAGIEQV